VFQSYALFPHMTVAQNVAFPLRMSGKSNRDTERLTREALESVHLSDKVRHYPHELSGGQKQRVALARGIVNKPRVLLLDEPLGALDAKLREEMQLELINLQRDVGITFVFVTHAQYEALALSHRIAVMNEGRIEQLDEPSRIYGFPRNRFVANFIGNINLLDAEVIEVGSAALRLEVDGLGEVRSPLVAARPGQKGFFAIRPEQVHIAGLGDAPQCPNHFAGRVRDLLYVGDITTYIVDVPGGLQFEALLPNSAPGRAKFFEVGDPVTLQWRDDAGVFLSE